MSDTHDTVAWQSLDAAHYLHPFTDHRALAARGTRVITRAEGVWLHDSEGHRILDGMSGLWCVALGYGRRELAEAAHRQMLELPTTPWCAWCGVTGRCAVSRSVR